MRYYLFTILLFFSIQLLGQQDGELIYIEHADLTRLEKNGEDELRILKGDVRMYQDSTFMFCDSARLSGNNLVAVGNVVIVQSDTISVFGDSLVYNSVSRKAKLFNNVTLENGDDNLYTHRLDYNVGTRVASYRDTALLVSHTTKLQSLKGVYDVNQKLATFKEYVVVRDSSFDLRADSLKYNTDLLKAIFISPTEIKSDTANIYCQNGFYDFNLKRALFAGDPQYQSPSTRADADTMYYDQRTGDLQLLGNAYYEELEKLAKAEKILYNEKTKSSQLIGDGYFKNKESIVEGEEIFYDDKTGALDISGEGVIEDGSNLIQADKINYLESGFGTLDGNVIWTDTSSQTSVFCEHAIYRKDIDYIKATSEQSRPYMQTVSEGDTMYMAADTLYSFNTYETDSLGNVDTLKILKAYNDVRLFKSNLRAIGDSLYFDDRDSIFTLFENPYVWSDSTQFSADTIDLYMKDGSLNRAHLKYNGLILNLIETDYFNQIKGRNINVFFEADTLDRMTVDGNAESIYYMLDKVDAFVGANTTICSKIFFKFSENDVIDIKFYEQPESKMIPIQEVDPIALRLPNFFWNEKSKPLSLEDILTKKVTVVPIKSEEALDTTSTIKSNDEKSDQ